VMTLASSAASAKKVRIVSKVIRLLVTPWAKLPPGVM
jgi:hypothetical protein